MPRTFVSKRIFNILRKENEGNPVKKKTYRQILDSVHESNNISLSGFGSTHDYLYINFIGTKEGTPIIRDIIKAFNIRIKELYPDIKQEEHYEILSSTYVNFIKNSKGKSVLKIYPVYRFRCFLSNKGRKIFYSVLADTIKEILNKTSLNLET